MLHDFYAVSCLFTILKPGRGPKNYSTSWINVINVYIIIISQTMSTISFIKCLNHVLCVIPYF